MGVRSPPWQNAAQGLLVAQTSALAQEPVGLVPGRAWAQVCSLCSERGLAASQDAPVTEQAMINVTLGVLRRNALTRQLTKLLIVASFVSKRRNAGCPSCEEFR